MPLVCLLLTAVLLQVPNPARHVTHERGEQSEAAGEATDVGELNLAWILDPNFRFELEEAIRKKNLTRAEELLVHEIETNPDAPQFELLTYLAGVFFYDKKYLNAAIAFQKAEAISPLDPGNRFTMAMCYILLGRNDWAKKELARLSAEVPDNPLYPYWLARIDYDENFYEDGIRKLKQIITRFPGFVKAYDRLALCYEALGRNEEAIATYRQAIELNRNQEEPWVWPPLNLGTLLIQEGDWQQAQTCLEEATRIDPGFAQAHYKLGLALEKQEKFEESKVALLRAAELDPEYPDPHWALARVLRRIGDREGARTAVQTYRKLKKAQEEKKTTKGS